jgi:hypothetical protein
MAIMELDITQQVQVMREYFTSIKKKIVKKKHECNRKGETNSLQHNDQQLTSERSNELIRNIFLKCMV